MTHIHIWANKSLAVEGNQAYWTVMCRCGEEREVEESILAEDGLAET